jgi:hypothetical protein
LKNVAVVETDQIATRSRSLIDMSGPAADYSPIANTHNVVLLPYPKKDVDKNDYRWPSKAGLKTSLSRGGAPDAGIRAAARGGSETGTRIATAPMPPPASTQQKDRLLRQQHQGSCPSFIPTRSRQRLMFLLGIHLVRQNHPVS